MRKLAVMGALAAGMLGLAGQSGAATVGTAVNGTMSNSDNGCINIIPLLSANDCSYAGTRAPPVGGWQGPIFVAAYYQLGSLASAEGFVPAPNDSKIQMPLVGNFTVDDNGSPSDGSDDKISGTFSFGAADHWVSTGNGDQALERWTSWDHTLAQTTVNFATAQPGGGFQYVIGVRGIPTPDPLNANADPSQIFSSEFAPPSIYDPTYWNNSFAILPRAQKIGIERSSGFGNANFPSNAAAQTTATLSGYACLDIDNDCTSSFIMVGSSTVPGSITTSLPPGFTNLVLVVTTAASGRIADGEAYWTREYVIKAGPAIAGDDPNDPSTWVIPNSWTGGRFTFTGCSPTGPIANPDSVSVDEGVTDALLSVLSNDKLGCDEPNTITIVTAPTHGTATVSPQGTGILYTPDRTGNVYYDGPDSLTYTITDSAVPTPNVSGVATVNITVNQVVPTAQNCTGSSVGGAPATCTVITSESIGSGTIQENTILPGAGTLGSCTASGAVLTFTPTAGGGNGTGGCSFQIQDADGDVSNTAQFTVTISGNSASSGGGGGPSLPSGGSSLDLLGLGALLAGLPLAARRRKRQR